MKIKYSKWIALILPVLFLLLTIRAAAAQKSSLNWAGYVANKGTFSAVGGTWIVPDVRNNKSFKTDAAWVGIGGVNNQDLIQAGTQSITGVSGKVAYSAWFEMLPDYSRPIPVAVNSGDSVTVDIKQISKNKWRIDFVNNTSEKKFQKLVSYKSTLGSAEWIEEMPSDGNYDLIPLDNFKNISFSNAYAIQNGNKVDIARSKASKVFMANKTGRVLAAPSVLGSDGASFEVDRLGKNSNLLLPTAPGSLQ